MQGAKAIKLRTGMCVCIVFLLIIASFSNSNAAPIKGNLSLKSQATGKYVVTWNDGTAIDLHATALTADSRAAITVIDAENGYIAIRSIGENKYWTVQGSVSDAKVQCSSSDVIDEALFSWIQNPDSTVSFLSKANNRYLSVVKQDTTIIPDSNQLASNKGLIITPDMLQPYVNTFYILHAAASSIGIQEKFTVAAGTLKKSSAIPTRGFKVLDFFNTIFGKQAVGGIHNKEPNSAPTHATNWLFQQTGVYPGLYSADFQFQAIDQTNRGIMIDTAIAQWKKGAVINLNYHMCSPLTTESCGWDPGVGHDKPSPTQFADLLTNGTALNTTLKTRLKNIAPWFDTLKSKGVEVMFRPWHEMNQGFFWWGGYTGTNSTAKLYQITRDYMEKELGITNIIWIWNVQDLNGINGWSSYNPGSNYFDIMSVDVYSGSFSTSYNGARDIAGDKPLGVGECYRMPTSAELSSQPNWVYFCRWDEDNPNTQTQEVMKSIMTAGNVLSLNEMPGWGTTTVSQNEKQLDRRPAAYFNVTQNRLVFELSEKSRVNISLVNSQGQVGITIVNGEYTAGAHAASFARSKLQPGVYFVKFSAQNRETIRKIVTMK